MEGSYVDHPIDHIEPDEQQNDFRERAYKELALILGIIQSLHDAPEGPKRTIALWQLSYALGHPICQGVSMHERAMSMGYHRATISKGAVAFCQQQGLPPSFYMKSQESRSSYAKTRKSQLCPKKSHKA